MRAHAVVAALGVALLAGGCGSSHHADEPDDLSASAHDGAIAADLASVDEGDGGDDLDSGPPTVSPEWKSGTRLRAKVYEGGAGASVFSTWHDTMLDVDCTWIVNGSGGIICAPTGDAFVIYSDASCSQPVIQSPACEAAPKIVGMGAVCGTPTFYSVGAAISAPAMAYASSGGTCQALGPAADPSYAFYAVGATVPVSAMVAATVVREARGAQLATDVLETADGALDARAILDSAHDAHCRKTSLTQGALTSCQPAVRAFEASFYADASCTTQLGYFPQLDYQPFCSEGPAAIYDSNDVAYAVGALDATTMPYRLTGSACAVFTSGEPSTRYYDVGAALGANAFAAFDSTTEGTERIRAVALTSTTGDRLFGAGFTDSQRMEGCVPAETSDGTLRCLPSLGYSTAFKDASCTMPVLQVASTQTVPDVFAVENAPSICKTQYAFYTTGTALAVGTALYTNSGGGACVPDGTSSAGDYDSAGAVTPGTFATMTLVQE